MSIDELTCGHEKRLHHGIKEKGWNAVILEASVDDTVSIWCHRQVEKILTIKSCCNFLWLWISITKNFWRMELQVEVKFQFLKSISNRQIVGQKYQQLMSVWHKKRQHFAIIFIIQKFGCDGIFEIRSCFHEQNAKVHFFNFLHWLWPQQVFFSFVLAECFFAQFLPL